MCLFVGCLQAALKTVQHTKRTQPVFHPWILRTRKTLFPSMDRTLYAFRHLYTGCAGTGLILWVAPVHTHPSRLPRKSVLSGSVKRKPFAHSKSVFRELHNEVKKSSVSKAGHRFTDYIEFLETYNGIVVQMDCVEGIRTDHTTLLTLHRPSTHMQIAIIMSDHTAVEVVKALDKIKEALGNRELFQKYFGVILTDNGHEFMDIKRMERSIYGGKRTKIFFCDPNRSDQKAECECNHKLIRRVIPKGTSFESLMQADISLMMNHINSYKRNELMGKTPYEVSQFMMPPDFDDFCLALGLEDIAAEEVILAPKLLQSSSPKVNATK